MSSLWMLCKNIRALRENVNFCQWKKNWNYLVIKLQLNIVPSFLSTTSSPSSWPRNDNNDSTIEIIWQLSEIMLPTRSSVELCNIKHVWKTDPDSKVHGVNMGPTWVLSAQDGPHVGPMNLAIGGSFRIEEISYASLDNALISGSLCSGVRMCGYPSLNTVIYIVLCFKFCSICNANMIFSSRNILVICSNNIFDLHNLILYSKSYQNTDKQRQRWFRLTVAYGGNLIFARTVSGQWAALKHAVGCIKTCSGLY